MEFPRQKRRSVRCRWIQIRPHPKDLRHSVLRKFADAHRAIAHEIRTYQCANTSGAKYHIRRLLLRSLAKADQNKRHPFRPIVPARANDWRAARRNKMLLSSSKNDELCELDGAEPCA